MSRKLNNNKGTVSAAKQQKEDNMKYTVELQKVIDNMDLSRLSLSEIYALSDYMNEKAGDKFSSLMTPLRKEDICDELKAEISNHVGKVVNADTGEILQYENGHITGVGLKSDTSKTKVSLYDITGIAGQYIEVNSEDADKVRKLIREAKQKINEATKIEGELYADPIQFSAASLNINLGGEAHNICKLESGERVITNKDMIGELKAKSIKAGCIPTTHVQPGISFNALVAASIKNKQAFRKEANEKLKQSVQQEIDDKAFAEALSKTIISLMKRLRK